MLGRVLVPVDGTDAAETVLPAVAALHQATGCEAVFLHIVALGTRLGSWVSGPPLAPPPA